MALVRILLSMLLLGCSSYVLAQDSLLYVTVQAVEIQADKLDLIGKELKPSTQQLVGALTNTSSIHVQSSGPGLLSTALIHGFGARHTAILWQEFNIQSPLNGTFDLGLLTGFNKVSYTDKSLSAYLGTASLGGAIILDNHSDIKTTEVGLTVNTTDNLKASVAHSFQLQKLSSQISLTAIRNNNSFKYRWGGEDNKWLTEVRGTDIKWNNAYQFSKQLSLDGNIWISTFERKLPSSLASTSSFANQVDDNYRYQFALSYTTDQYAAKLSYAHFDEQLNYVAAGVDSKANNKVNALNFSLSNGKHKLNISHRADRADASFFTTIHTRNLSTVSYLLDHTWKSGISNRIILTEQLHDGEWSPPLFDLSTTYTSKNIIADLTLSSAYNTPTLNDLYWPQGGNPDLLPEHSYGVDGSLKYLFDRESFIAIDPYYKRVSNWILWTPGDQFWSPKNQRSVVSRGFDISVQYKVNQLLSSGIEFTYTNASIAEEISFKELEGNQLLYIPKIKSSLWIDYIISGWQVRPQALFVSRRFTTTDNENSIPSFLTVDLQIMKQLELKENKTIDIGVTVFNLFNEDYQQVEFYPMPLRYFELNLNYKINRK